MTKLKIFVLMLSRTYPATHPMKGIPTYFGQKVVDGSKAHTLRGNYAKWKRIEAIVNAGKGIVSLREWPLKAYQKDTTPVEIKQLNRIYVQKAHIYPVKRSFFPGSRYSIFIDQSNQALRHPLVFACRDGLDLASFAGFFPKPLEDLALIHFTEFKY